MKDSARLVLSRRYSSRMPFLMLKVLFGGIKTNLTILILAVPDVIHSEPHAQCLRFSLFYGEPIVRYELHDHMVKMNFAL